MFGGHHARPSRVILGHFALACQAILLNFSALPEPMEITLAAKTFPLALIFFPDQPKPSHVA